MEEFQGSTLIFLVLRTPEGTYYVPPSVQVQSINYYISDISLDESYVLSVSTASLKLSGTEELSKRKRVYF